MNEPKSCENCDKWISKNIAWYSLRQYGKELCIACQIEEKTQRKSKKKSS